MEVVIGKLQCNKGVLHLNKRTIEISSIEIMAILGLLIWLITILLRHYYSINSVVPIFFLHPVLEGRGLRQLC